MSGKTKREIKTITDDILKTLKVIDSLSVDNAKSTPSKKKVTVNLEVLKKLKKTANDLRDDISFFIEGKKVASEALEEVKNGDISTKEKAKIIDFINNNYEKEKHIKDDPSSLDQEKLTKILTGFSNDADKYAEKLNKKLQEIEERIREEENKQLDLRRYTLKEEMEDSGLALVEEKRNLFNKKLEKLQILEDELSLAIMERDNQKQIDDMRNLLNEKIS